MRCPHCFGKAARCLAIVLMMVTTGPFAGNLVHADQITALVPAYFYPTWWEPDGSPWDDLNAAAARIPIEAIMNPDSGPGTAVNSDYVVAVDQLHAAGGKVIGYIYTGYGSISADDIIADVVDYVCWYGVDGIFLDAMGNQDGDLDYVGLYTTIQELACEAGIELHVVGNPGIPFESVEALIPAADTLVIFEGPFQNADPTQASFQLYPTQGPYAGLPLWFLNYNSSQFANLVYAVSTPLEMFGSLIKAVIYNAGYVYLTDGQLPNPYGGLPSYWDLEVDLIELLNDLQ